MMKEDIIKFERKIKDLQELLEIGNSLNSNLKYSTLLDSLLLTCMGRATVKKAGLFIRHNVSSTEFTLYRNYEGFNLEKDIVYSINEKSELINSLKRISGCITMPELLSDIKNTADIKPFTILEPSLIIPIVMKNDLQGIIVLGERVSKTSFSIEEKVFLRNVADLGAIAIHNAFLLEVSSTDMMTKLKMKHILFENIRNGISDKELQPFTLMMLDIDHFKNLNDTYGHSFGDIIITDIASIIINNIRLEDVGARYGGEEFTIVLFKLQKNEALKIAERIRKSVEKREFKFGNKIVKSTISTGIAQFESNMDIIPQDLIERADQALYMAKENGRNQIFTE